MEWAKLAGEVLKFVVEARTNAEFVQATSERDMYKEQVDHLNSRLEKIEREKYSNGNKSFRGHKSGYKNSSNSQGSHAKSRTSDFHPPGSSSKGRGMHQSASQKSSTSGFNSSSGRGNLRNKGHGRGRDINK